ncbi:MAG: 4-hydroxy-tetrahydrodipicolinate synthase [Thermoproteota archaeon]|jgi:dihydrodipicolinate synthase (EC 4.2.1.52)
MGFEGFKGCITAIVTPFQKNLEVDFQGLRRLISFQIENGIDGIVVLGTTGESPTITEEERKQILKVAVDVANGKIPVIAGTGTYSTAESIKMTREAAEIGVDGALIVAPYYNKPTQEGLYRHFKAIAESVDIPIILYNIPGRTGVNIEVSTQSRLLEINNIVSVKEASGNIQQIMDVISILPSNKTVLSGDDNLTFPIMACGGKGVISVVSNILPRQVKELVTSVLNGNLQRAREIHYNLMPIFKAAFLETNPIPIKTAMNLVGLPAGPCRPPLCEMSQQNLDKLKTVLRKYYEIPIQ